MARCGGGRGRGLNYFIVIAITTLAIRGVTHRVGETRPHIVTSSSGARRGEKTWRLGVTGHSSFRRHLRGRHERDKYSEFVICY